MIFGSLNLGHCFEQFLQLTRKHLESRNPQKSQKYPLFEPFDQKVDCFCGPQAMCKYYHPMQEDNLEDPRRIEFVRKTDKGIQSRAPTVKERVIINKHVAIHRLKNNAISFGQKVGRIC